jgi:hypothetical protein
MCGLVEQVHTGSCVLNCQKCAAVNHLALIRAFSGEGAGDCFIQYTPRYL